VREGPRTLGFQTFWSDHLLWRILMLSVLIRMRSLVQIQAGPLDKPTAMRKG
jgi:hypothetical protein